MNEPNAQTEQQPAEATKLPEPQPTLDELFTEYDIGRETPAASPPNAAPPPAEPPAPTATDETAIHQKLAALERTISADRQERVQAQEEADFKSAVAKLGKNAGIEGKDTMLRGYLIAQATEDPRLRTLWERRNMNPKAWAKALEILADDVRDQFAVPNPQLEENQRAMDESQRAQSTSAPPPQKPEDKVMGMSDPEFSNFWAKLTGRGF